MREKQKMDCEPYSVNATKRPRGASKARDVRCVDSFLVDVAGTMLAVDTPVYASTLAGSRDAAGAARRPGHFNGTRKAGDTSPHSDFAPFHMLIDRYRAQWSAVVERVDATGIPQAIQLDGDPGAWLIVQAAEGMDRRYRCMLCPPVESDSPTSDGTDVPAPTGSECDSNDQALRDRSSSDFCSLSAIGRQTAQVAHELNNALDGVLRYVNLSLRLVQEEPTDPLVRYLSETRTGLRRMIAMIGDLLAFSRTSSGEMDPVDVNTAVDDALRSLADLAAARGIAISCSYDSADMPTVRSPRLYQVCVNLIKNAIDAMERGGRLTIKTTRTDTEMIIEFGDTGHGLPQDADVVFEPFYSSKSRGQGTGIGLAICREFVEAWGGHLRAHDNPDLVQGQTGSLFVVTVPLAAFDRGTDDGRAQFVTSGSKTRPQQDNGGEDS